MSYVWPRRWWHHWQAFRVDSAGREHDLGCTVFRSSASRIAAEAQLFFWGDDVSVRRLPNRQLI